MIVVCISKYLEIHIKTMLKELSSVTNGVWANLIDPLLCKIYDIVFNYMIIFFAGPPLHLVLSQLSLCKIRLFTKVPLLLGAH